MMKSRRILALEPYYGGSHKAWLDGLSERSRHKFDLIDMPPRKWKWRMRGAAIAMAERFWNEYADTQYDALLATDLMNLADFLAFTRPRFDDVPVVLYMHENQLSYPLHPGERIDYQYAITNLASILAATRVVFNSEYNRCDFFQGIRKLLSKMPDFKPDPKLLDRVERDSGVIAPAVDLQSLKQELIRDGGSPVLLWNHRWDRDKQPEVLVDALRELVQRDEPFRVIICGEAFRDTPACLLDAQAFLGDRLIHFGYAESREAYANLLAQSDIIVSTSMQEFFGISVVEAIYAGAFPVLPDRLNYPYLIPNEHHRAVLYDDGKLVDKLSDTMRCVKEGTLPDMRYIAEPHDWSELMEQYDALFDVVGMNMKDRFEK
jgi:glycosyltransferase involved in cell wall biosynthesis